MCQAEHQVPPSEQRIRVESPKMTASRRGFNLTSQTRAHPSSGGSTSSRYGNCQRTHLIINGRHVAISLLLLVGLCGGTAAGTPGSADTRCDAGQFQCRDGGCILQAKMCDGRGDCKDSSDELDCGEHGWNQCRRSAGGGFKWRGHSYYGVGLTRFL